jgi:hypothetical protein
MTKSLKEPLVVGEGAVGRRNAIVVPSGDQTGKRSSRPSVRRVSPVPVTPMTKIPVSPRVNATRLPSGEKAGSVAARTPVVTCFRPAPVVVIRKSCEGWVPCYGEAAKTIQVVDEAAPLEAPVISTAPGTIAAIQACAFTHDTHCRAVVKKLLTRRRRCMASTVRISRL